MSLVSPMLSKNELENSNVWPSLLGQKFLVCFLEELKKTKSPVEINWPLVLSLASDPYLPSLVVSSIKNNHTDEIENYTLKPIIFKTCNISVFYVGF